MAECCIPRQIHNSAQISEVNCAPLSDVIVIIVGTPKRAKLKNILICADSEYMCETIGG